VKEKESTQLKQKMILLKKELDEKESQLGNHHQCYYLS
jgi:hypothetical protein